MALCLVAALCVGASHAHASRPPAAAIATAHPLATAAGKDILSAGGNAFDAAVAVSAALAVVEPYSSGLGGGGFWLLHVAASGRDVMVDGRERAPLAATADMYLDADGEFVPARSLNGPLAAGIPGAPAALAHIAERYGRLPLAASLVPAIELARDGFEIDPVYTRLARWRRDAIAASPAAAAQFLAGDAVPAPGTRLRQPELATTLLHLARDGHDGFYGGEVARLLVAGVRAGGGIWRLRDLAQYRVVERAPISARFEAPTGRWRLVSAPPPSSGGVALVQMLHMLSGFDVAALAPADRAHLLIETMRRAYRDRAEFLGDPDYVDVPVARLTDPRYAAGLMRNFRMDRATPSPPPEAVRAEGADTTHFSILDTDGNRVAATLSINYPFGSGFVPPGTGVLLNDEMDDFAARPGVPNAYGLIGGDANAIAPGKRMLSSMSPTFIESDAEVVILGTPGGSRIITMVLEGLLAATGLDPTAGGGARDWVAAGRFHHQYLPDEVVTEPDALSPAVRRSLERRGHRLSTAGRPYGNMQLVRWRRAQRQVEAASDPRGIGAATVIEAAPAATVSNHRRQPQTQPLRTTP
ncbi:gamma-glutamyltransferase [uncultured Thiohalocapsa sp.]|uniref:gamma-glutamyltransferase n=1 Tax=uncultured Thiohalocapsa sp. TaxID=768990 RepID=UPI003457B855